MASEDEREVVAELAKTLGQIARATSDSSEAQAAAAHARRLEACASEELEALVRAVRDELEHYKGTFNDSRDQSEKILVLRSDARAAAKRGVNFFVVKRRPDLGFAGP